MRDLCFIPECYVDTALVESVLKTDGVNHQKGCFTVSGVMENKFVDSFAVGIVDFDKRRPAYLNGFVQIASSTHLALVKHKTKPHYVVFVKPAMDGFVLSCAEELGIKIETFGLPSDLKAFTRETKTITTQDDKRFKALFLHLRNAGEIKILGNVLNYLKDKKYAAAIDDLKQLMRCVDDSRLR
jgi:hypothetical protein